MSAAYHGTVIRLIDIYQAVNQSNAFVARLEDDNGNNPFSSTPRHKFT